MTRGSNGSSWIRPTCRRPPRASSPPRWRAEAVTTARPWSRGICLSEQGIVRTFRSASPEGLHYTRSKNAVAGVQLKLDATYGSDYRPAGGAPAAGAAPAGAGGGSVGIAAPRWQVMHWTRVIWSAGFLMLAASVWLIVPAIRIIARATSFAGFSSEA